jgi:small redox-active disulfide protein 2
MSNDIVQVLIGGRSIGIVGLRKVMADLAGNASGRTDAECREFLHHGISAQNYISPKMEEAYKDALLRAFKAFTGEAIEELPVSGVRIQVLGPGCHNCARLEQDVREVLAELKMPGELSHVTDPAEIAKYGLMGVPALVINGRVVCVGTLPHRNRIKQWLIDLRASEECKEGK